MQAVGVAQIAHVGKRNFVWRMSIYYCWAGGAATKPELCHLMDEGAVRDSGSRRAEFSV